MIFECERNMAWRLCSSHLSFHQEIVLMRLCSVCRGLAEDIFLKIFTTLFLSTKYASTDRDAVQGPERKHIFRCFHMGFNDFKIQKQIQNALRAVFSWGSNLVLPLNQLANSVC